MFSARKLQVCARALFLFASGAAWMSASEAATAVFRSDVDLVSLSFTVSDSRGEYIKDLKPEDIRIYEDDVEQQVAVFVDPVRATESPVENSVFILMDTSSSMYEEFMHASDTVSSFVRGVAPNTGIAVYTFSRNMFRATPLTQDHVVRVNALRNTVLGDETAIFNSLLLTVRDASRVPGNKTIILLSNGPDTASLVSPDDVARVAREEGIPINIVFTREKDELMNAVFSRVAAGTGGRVHVARNWDQQRAAFNLIREELNNSYTVAYYPKPTENEGFRKITIEIASDPGKRYRIQARPGYKPGTRQPGPCMNCRFAQVQPAGAMPAGGAAAGPDTLASGIH